MADNEDVVPPIADSTVAEDTNLPNVDKSPSRPASSPVVEGPQNLLHRVANDGGGIVPIQLRDDIGTDLFRADGFTLILVGAISEAFRIHLVNHREDALVLLRLSLGKAIEVIRLGTDEQHGTRILAGCHTGPATDTGGGVERIIGIILRNGDRIRVGSRTRSHPDVPARSDDAVKGASVDNQIFHDRESTCTKGFNPDRISIAEFPHVNLAGRDPLLSAVRDTIDGQGTHSTDPFAAIMIEVDWFSPVVDDPCIHDIEHLQEGGRFWDVFRFVGLDTTRVVFVGLTPDFECEIHDLGTLG